MKKWRFKVGDWLSQTCLGSAGMTMSGDIRNMWILKESPCSSLGVTPCLYELKITLGVPLWFKSFQAALFHGENKYGFWEGREHMYNFVISLSKTIGFRWHWFQMSTKKVTKFKQKCLCISETLSSNGRKNTVLGNKRQIWDWPSHLDRWQPTWERSFPP